MGTVPMPISVSRGHFALRYEVPKFLARGGHLCMAMLTIAKRPSIRPYMLDHIQKMHTDRLCALYQSKPAQLADNTSRAASARSTHK